VTWSSSRRQASSRTGAPCSLSGPAGWERSAGREPERGGAWPHDGEPLEATAARLGLEASERKVLRSFLVDGRLVSIPVRGSRRDVILRFLRERVFTEDRDYPEKEVNQRLALFHPDVASLRRYLVDESMVTRAAGLYRRAVPEPVEEPFDGSADGSATT
jgi:hypothetical protein